MKLKVLLFLNCFQLCLAFHLYAFKGDEASVFNNSESDLIEFQNPDGYKDQEFEELQKAYINPKFINLEDIQKLPLDQMSTDFIQKLIDIISARVTNNVKSEMLDYLNNILKKRSATELIKNIPKVEMIEKESLEYKKNVFPQTYQRPPLKKIIIENNLNPYHVASMRNSYYGGIHKINFAHNTPFININGLSKENMSFSVWYKGGVNFLDMSIYVKNISNGMVYLLKRFTSSVKSPGNKSFIFSWNKPQIPFGKYKIMIIGKFLAGNKLLNRVDKYWGSPDNNNFIIFKN